MFHLITRDGCGFCDNAKNLLRTEGHEFTTDHRESEEEIAAFKAAGHKTFPQIWHGDFHVGGFTDLVDYLD